MPLHLGGGGYVPVLRWKSNQVSFVITTVRSGPNGDEVADMPIQLQQMLVDFWNIRTGWCCLGKGQSPQWTLDADLDTPGPNPNPAMEYKRAFLVRVYNSQLFEGVNVRHWGEPSVGSAMGVQAAYTEFEAQRAQHSRSELPIVQMHGFENRGQFNVPKLSVVGWAPRPAELADEKPEPGMSANPATPNGGALGHSVTPPTVPAQPQQTAPAPPPAAPAYPVSQPQGQPAGGGTPQLF